MALRLRVDGLHVVAALERVHHEVLQPVGHRRGVRVHDHQHLLLGPPIGQHALGELLGTPECSFGHEAASKRTTPFSSTSRTRRSFSRMSMWPSTSDRVRYAWVTATFPHIAWASS